LEIKLTQLAELDLEEISQYLIRTFPDKSESTYAKIEKACQNLIDYPTMGRVGSTGNTRELKIGNLPYCIVYRVRKQCLTVLRIYHTSREPLNK